MLNKVYHYKKIKNTNAMMFLLLAKLQEDDYDENINRHDFTERLKEYFSPAINSNLMQIVELDFSKEETEECYIKNKQNE